MIVTPRIPHYEAVLITKEMLTNFGPFPDWMLDDDLKAGKTLKIHNSEWVMLRGQELKAGDYVVLQGHDPIIIPRLQFDKIFTIVE